MRAIAVAAVFVLRLTDAAAQDAGPDAGSKAQGLEEELAAAIAGRVELASARVGLAIIDLASGRMLAQHAQGELFDPGESADLVTAATALAALGPSHRFVTTLGAREQRGAVAADLVLRGAGNPFFTTEDLWQLTADLRRAGIRRIEGSLTIDSSPFPEAMVLDHNRVTVLVQPAEQNGTPPRVSLVPRSDYFTVVNEAATVAEGPVMLRVTSRATGDKTEIHVAGAVRADSPAARVSTKVFHPSLFIGETLRATLAAQGIDAAAPIQTGVVVAPVRDLASHVSEPLAVLLRRFHRQRDPLDAATLLKVVGGSAPASAWLTSAGIPEGTYRLSPGDGDRFSPAQMAAILRHAYRDFRYGSEFVAALPVGIAGRRMRVKTGTSADLSYAVGYAGGNGRGPIAFALFVNGLGDRRESTRAAQELQDEIARVLLSHVTSGALKD